MMPRWFSRFLAMSVLGLLPSPASSQWAPDGVWVHGPERFGYSAKVVADGSGGIYVAWVEILNSSQTGDDVYMQRVTSAGTIAPGWPAGGVPVCVLPNTQDVNDIAIDGLGGALTTWVDFRNANASSQDVYAQRVMGDGTLPPGWSVNGIAVSRAADYQDLPVVAPDGSGGAYVAWMDYRSSPFISHIYAQHLAADGTVVPSWPQEGLAVCTAGGGQGLPLLMPDGIGGVLVVWNDSRNRPSPYIPPDVYGQRLSASGALVPGWVPDGNQLLNRRALRSIASDQQNGFYLGVVTNEAVCCADSSYYVQRFTHDGTVVPGWPTGGLEICDLPSSRWDFQLVEDGVGGAIMAWYDYRSGNGKIYASRVLPQGSLAPGWAANGKRLSDDTAPGHESMPSLAHDGQGGAYVAWELQGDQGYLSLIHHVTADGGVAPGWPPYGRLLASSRAQFQPQVVTDDQGGAIVVWEERDYPNRYGLYAQRFGSDGPVATELALASVETEIDRVTLVWYGIGAADLVSVVERRTDTSEWQSLGPPQTEGADRLRYADLGVSAGARYAYRLRCVEDGVERFTTETWVEVPRPTLALAGFRPNPAVGPQAIAFTLGDATPAKLEVIDIAGRRVATRDLTGLAAGRHEVRLDQISRLDPGVYLIRIRQGGRAAQARGVVLR